MGLILGAIRLSGLPGPNSILKPHSGPAKESFGALYWPGRLLSMRMSARCKASCGSTLLFDTVRVQQPAQSRPRPVIVYAAARPVTGDVRCRCKSTKPRTTTKRTTNRASAICQARQLFELSTCFSTLCKRRRFDSGMNSVSRISIIERNSSFSPGNKLAAVISEYFGS